MNEFWKKIQLLYIKNRAIECKVTYKNNIYKVIVTNGSKEVIRVSGMSAYDVFSLAEAQLAMHKEELV